jgi:hypothetical protein
MTCPTILLLLLVFVAAGKCLQSRYLAVKWGMHFIEPLASNDRRDAHADTQTDGRDLWSTPFILVQAFRCWWGGGYGDTQTGWRSHKPVLGKWTKTGFVQEHLSILQIWWWLLLWSFSLCVLCTVERSMDIFCLCLRSDVSNTIDRISVEFGLGGLHWKVSSEYSFINIVRVYNSHLIWLSKQT